MKYKVIELKELTKEILEEMLAEAYEDGYRDGKESNFKFCIIREIIIVFKLLY